MSSTATSKNNKISSDQMVNYIIRKGVMERGALYVGTGLVAGAMASIVLSRGGGSRKAITMFGAGIGLGSAWTRTSMDLEELFQS